MPLLVRAGFRLRRNGDLTIIFFDGLFDYINDILAAAFGFALSVQNKLRRVIFSCKSINFNINSLFFISVKAEMLANLVISLLTRTSSSKVHILDFSRFNILITQTIGDNNNEEAIIAERKAKGLIFSFPIELGKV